jgi:hypothetical protein
MLLLFAGVAPPFPAKVTVCVGAIESMMLVSVEVIGALFPAVSRAVSRTSTEAEFIVGIVQLYEPEFGRVFERVVQVAPEPEEYSRAIGFTARLTVSVIFAAFQVTVIDCHPL